MAEKPEGMVSSDWLVMMSPNNQAFSGKQISVAEGTGDIISRQKENGREQGKNEWQLICHRASA